MTAKNYSVPSYIVGEEAAPMLTAIRFTGKTLAEYWDAVATAKPRL
jgi:hypothetical protein